MVVRLAHAITPAVLAMIGLVLLRKEVEVLSAIAGTILLLGVFSMVATSAEIPDTKLTVGLHLGNLRPGWCIRMHNARIAWGQA
ncbi:MAG: hypothetical protein D4R84_13210 [Rhodocyclaceae bacterium]|nr:MAG: hypothetical protein D4R84_13210 [Rhodocyclaceae bacterium]